MWKLHERFRQWTLSELGATTVEWLGLATIAVLVIALLLPQVRGTAGDIWNSVAGQFTSFFS